VPEMSAVPVCGRRSAAPASVAVSAVCGASGSATAAVVKPELRLCWALAVAPAKLNDMNKTEVVIRRDFKPLEISIKQPTPFPYSDQAASIRRDARKDVTATSLDWRTNASTGSNLRPRQNLGPDPSLSATRSWNLVHRPSGISMDAPTVPVRGSVIGLNESISLLVRVLLAPGRYKAR
jgi:hypothetical protein